MSSITPRFESLEEKLLVGKQLTTSVQRDRTPELWRSFGPRISEIAQKNSEARFSLQVYPEGYFEVFDPSAEFEKWAAVPVQTLDDIPEGLYAFVIPSGLYAVFNYKGLSSDPSIFRYIYGVWLPNSPYVLADRPHFEVLGERYRNNDPNSEEEIWIPIEAAADKSI